LFESVKERNPSGVITYEGRYYIMIDLSNRTKQNKNYRH